MLRDELSVRLVTWLTKYCLSQEPLGIAVGVLVTHMNQVKKESLPGERLACSREDEEAMEREGLLSVG